MGNDIVGIRIPNLFVLLLSITVGVLAVYLDNVTIATICFLIAAAYAIVILWQWRHPKD